MNEELVGEALEPVRDGSLSRRSSASRSIRAAIRRRARQPARRRSSERSRARCGGSAPNDRPPLPAPGRPERADRRRGRRGQGADRGGQGPALRPLGGRRAERSAARTPCSRSPPSRASTPSGGASRGRDPADARGARHRLRAFSPLGRGFLTGQIDEKTTFDERRHPQQYAALHRPGAQGEPRPRRPAGGDRRTQGARHRRRSRSPGCWRRSRGSSRSRARRSCTGWRRTSARADIELTADDLREIEEARSRRRTAPATPKLTSG